jgi:spore germination protein GerM
VRRVLSGALLAVVAGLLLVGCGIAPTASPTTVAPRSVPYGLLAPPTTTTTPAEPSDNVTIYLMGESRLVTVNRAVVAPASIARALAALGRGPTTEEVAEGLDSPISTVTPITFRSLNGSTATVGLPASFAQLGGQEEIVAAAQLVFTVTAFPGVEKVSVLIGGKPATIPTGGGSLSSGALSRSDYGALAPL